jgi:hypothetical protein
MNPEAIRSIRTIRTNKFWWDPVARGRLHVARARRAPALTGVQHRGPVRPHSTAARERVRDARPSGRRDHRDPAGRIRDIALELGATARQQIELPIRWIDMWGKTHGKSPAIRLLSMRCADWPRIRTLPDDSRAGCADVEPGTIDRPGGFRHKAPFRRAIPPNRKAAQHMERHQAEHAARHGAAGFPTTPRRSRGRCRRQAIRIDKGFSWEHPLSAHGLMHNVITNAWRGDP